MNKVFLIGNLTKEPELSETSSGVSLCKFTIAVNRNYTGADGERKTDFFNCIAWRGLGETVARYMHKGSKLAVVGSIELRTYEDNNGKKRNATDIIVNDIEFLTSRNSENMHDSSSQNTPRKPMLEPLDDDTDIPF